MSETTHRFHLHIENSPALGPVFEITHTRVEKALQSYPSLANDIYVTIGGVDTSFDEAIDTADVLFGWDFDRSIISRKGNHLRWIQLQGAGVNHLLPLDWVPEGIPIANSRGAHGKRASEYLMMSLLALNNGLPTMVTNQHKRTWAPIHSEVITGKTLLIVGVGHIGGDVAERAKHFGLHTLGMRRTAKPHRFVDEMYSPDALLDLLPRADFVIVTAPHTPATNRIIGKQEFGVMKRGAGFVNYSRAGLVDYDALRDALSTGYISAVVDVFDEEPLPESSLLWDTPNLIITPHSSSNDPVNHARRSLELLFENVSRYMAGKSLLNIVNPEQQY